MRSNHALTSSHPHPHPHLASPRPTRRPILLIGPTGTGKSVYVQQKLMNGLPQDKYIPTFVNFSAQTSANQTQVII